MHIINNQNQTGQFWRLNAGRCADPKAMWLSIGQLDHHPFGVSSI